MMTNFYVKFNHEISFNKKMAGREGGKYVLKTSRRESMKENTAQTYFTFFSKLVFHAKRRIMPRTTSLSLRSIELKFLPQILRSILQR